MCPALSLRLYILVLLLEFILSKALKDLLVNPAFFGFLNELFLAHAPVEVSHYILEHLVVDVSISVNFLESSAQHLHLVVLTVIIHFN